MTGPELDKAAKRLLDVLLEVTEDANEALAVLAVVGGGVISRTEDPAIREWAADYLQRSALQAVAWWREGDKPKETLN